MSETHRKDSGKMIENDNKIGHTTHVVQPIL